MKNATTLLLCLATLLPDARAQVLTWERDNLAVGEVDRIVITDAGALFAVTGAGLYRSTNKGESWQQVHEAYIYGPLELPNGDLLAADYFNVLKSSDGGDTWETLQEREVRSFHTDGTRLFAGGGWGELWLVSNDLQTWTVLNQAVLDDGHLQMVPLIYARGDLLVYEHALSGLWISRDGGSTWGLQPYYTAPSFLCPVGDEAYLTHDFGTYTGIAGTRDFETFTKVSNIPTSFPSAGVFRQNLFVLGALEGPWVSVDFGATWTLSADGLSDALIHSLAVDDEGYVYAGTHAGIQRSKTPLLSLSVEPAVPAPRFDLQVPSPDPFRTRTTFVATIDQPQHLRFEVFNQVGQRIRVLVDGILPTGSYRLDFDGTGLPTGPYFLRAVGEDATVVRSALLVR